MNTTVRISGSMMLTNQQHDKLKWIHSYLMKAGINYHEVSVVLNSSGYCCYFAASAKDKITDRMKVYMKEEGFNYVINS